MTDSPTNKPDAHRQPSNDLKSGASTSGSTSSTSAPKPTFSDPERRPIGDKPDDVVKHTDGSRPKDASRASWDSKADTQGGEGHQGPDVDATHVDSDAPKKGDRPAQGQPQKSSVPPSSTTNPKPATPQRPTDAGGDCSTSGKGTDANSGRSQNECGTPNKPDVAKPSSTSGGMSAI